jgi:hypothetical protein
MDPSPIPSGAASVGEMKKNFQKRWPSLVGSSAT